MKDLVETKLNCPPKTSTLLSVMKNKYTIEQLNGTLCTHGSPGYPTPEAIEDIVPYKGKPLNGVVNQELWEVQFESGCFTILKDEALQTLLKEGECHYDRAAGFNAMEVIKIL